MTDGDFRADLARRQKVRTRRASSQPEPEPEVMGNTGRMESMMRAARNVAREEEPESMSGRAMSTVDKVIDKVHNPSFVTGFLAVGVVCFMAYRDLVTMKAHTDALLANTQVQNEVVLAVREAADSVRAGNMLVAELDDELAKVREIDQQMDQLGGQFWQQRQLLVNALRAFDEAHEEQPRRARASLPAEPVPIGNPWSYGAPAGGNVRMP